MGQNDDVEEIGDNTERAYNKAQRTMDLAFVNITQGSDVTVAEASARPSIRSRLVPFQRQVCEFQQLHVLLDLLVAEGHTGVALAAELGDVLVGDIVECVVEADAGGVVCLIEQWGLIVDLIVVKHDDCLVSLIRRWWF